MPAQLAVVSNSGSSSVSVIDLTSNTVVHTISVGVGPRGIDLNEACTIAVVANFTAGTASILDLAAGTVLATVAAGTQPIAVAVSGDGTLAYVCNLSGGVTVIDLIGLAVVTTISGFSVPAAVVFNAGATLAYVANQGGTTVSIVDVATHSITGTLSGFHGPVNLELDPTGTLLIVSNNSAANFQVVDLASSSVILSVAASSTSPGGGLAVGHRYVYLCDGTNLRVYDYRIGFLVASASPVIVGANGVIVNPAESEALVASTTLTVVNLTPLPGSPSTSTTIGVGVAPRQVAGKFPTAQSIVMVV